VISPAKLTMTNSLHHDLEAAGFAAWPCFKEENYNGWHLRFAEGFTKRANSVNAGSRAQALSDQDLEHIESRYSQRSLPTIFRLCSVTRTPTLDDRLAVRGYTRIDASLVMATRQFPSADNRFKHRSLPAAEWLESYYAISTESTQSTRSHLRLLQSLPKTTHFAVNYKDGAPRSCGIGVLTNQHLGLFEVATQDSNRRQGLASELCGSLLSWGASQAATTAFLQVEQANLAAIRIYEVLGFRHAYDYWYRVSAK
jgi:N-acetylglutamate synthase